MAAIPHAFSRRSADAQPSAPRGRPQSARGIIPRRAEHTQCSFFFDFFFDFFWNPIRTGLPLDPVWRAYSNGTTNGFARLRAASAHTRPSLGSSSLASVSSSSFARVSNSSVARVSSSSLTRVSRRGLTRIGSSSVARHSRLGRRGLALRFGARLSLLREHIMIEYAVTAVTRAVAHGNDGGCCDLWGVRSFL
jgi:hypothetical protein